MTEGASFNLVDRPWIVAQTLDGRAEELSLLELFQRAARLRGVLGDLPTQTFALVRLLLAILHRSVDGPADHRQWRALWRSGGLADEEVAAYLERHRDRFDLLHPETPFLQVAGLRTAKGEMHKLNKLIADVPNGLPFFTTRTGPGVERLTFAEAARWVVNTHAFDISGIKPGAVGDSRVKGGKGYPIGVGWAGKLGGVFVEGRNLRETLLLNLLPERFAGIETSETGEDLPVWERPPHTAAVQDLLGRPTGPVDLYTWQTRRVRLAYDATGVHGVLAANGDPLAPQNRHRQEPMSAWRRSQAQEKKLGKPLVYMPKEHEPDRAVWRGLAALLPNVGDVQGAAGAAALAPAVMEWVGELGERGYLPPDLAVRTRTIGVLYGAQQSSIDEVIDDSCTVAVALLKESNRDLGVLAVTAAADADNAAKALGDLAANLAAAAGGDGAGPRSRAREGAYAAMDAAFRRWLAGLDEDITINAAHRDWQKQAYRIVRGRGDELVERAGAAAWIGRQVNKRHVATPLADLWFRSQLRKALPLAWTDNEVNA